MLPGGERRPTRLPAPTAATQTGTAQYLAVEALAPRAEASSLQLSALPGSDCDVWSCKCCAAAFSFPWKGLLPSSGL